MIPEENNETWPGIRKGRYWTAKRVERGEVALFLRVVDIRTRIRRLVGPRKVGGTNEDRESSTKNLRRHERDGATIGLFVGTRWKTKGGCGSGPTIISRDWPVGPTTGATWLDEPDPSVHQVRKTHLEKPCLRGWEWWSWMNVTRYRGSALGTWTNEFEASILLYASATIFLIVSLDAICDLWKAGVRIVKILLYRQVLIQDAMEDERCFRGRRILEHTMLVRGFLRDVRNVGTDIRYLFVRYKLIALLGRNLVSNVIIFFKMYENIWTF